MGHEKEVIVVVVVVMVVWRLRVDVVRIVRGWDVRLAVPRERSFAGPNICQGTGVRGTLLRSANLHAIQEMVQYSVGRFYQDGANSALWDPGSA